MFQLNKKYLQGAVLLYLLLPNILFLAGWVCWQVAIPCMLALAAGAFFVWRGTPSASVLVRRSDLFGLGAGLLLCLVSVDSTGIVGHTLQSGDFLTRTAIYDTLVRCDWPLFDYQGRYFVYYAAFWLPPALASKMVGNGISSYTLLQAWVTLGVMLAFLSLFCRWRGRAWVVLLIALALGSLYDVTRYFQYLGHWLNLHRDTGVGYEALRELSNALSPHALYFNMNYFSLWRALVTYTFHCTTPVLLLLSLFFGRMLPWRYILFVCSLVVLTSPLESLALLPLLAFVILPRLRQSGKELFAGVTWCALPLLACVASYLMSSDNSSARLLWQDSFLYTPRALQYRLLKYAIILPCCAVPAFCFLWKRYGKLSLFRAAVALMVILPVIWLGNTSNSDFLFKGSAVMYLCLAPLYASAWFHSTGKRKLALACFFIFFGTNMSSDVLMRVIPHYSWDTSQMTANIDSRWNGHLNHPEEEELTSLFFTEASLPDLLYKEPGASSKTVLRFAATGHLSTQDAPASPDAPRASAVIRK